jgi:hypothetical protein
MAGQPRFAVLIVFSLVAAGTVVAVRAGLMVAHTATFRT